MNVGLDTSVVLMSLEGLASAKPGLVDRLIHGGYAKSDAQMATFEKAASKLKSVQVL